MGRIVKQYQDAIKLHKAGKPIPIDELPTPPGENIKKVCCLNVVILLYLQ